MREKDGDKVLALFNLSPQPQTNGFTTGPIAGRYCNVEVAQWPTHAEFIARNCAARPA